MDGFLLTSAERAIRTDGARRTFTDPRAASAALRTGVVDMIVGAIPFDPEHPAALVEPREVTMLERPWRLDAIPELPAVTVTDTTPTPAEHLARVSRLAARIRADADRPGGLRKVVAARSITLRAAGEVDPLALASHLSRRHTSAHTYAVGLDAAGERFRGHTLVGASPELLVSRRGRVVACNPLAGTAPRRDDPDEDARAGNDLLHSDKNLAEHAFVVDLIRERLAPLCDDLTIADRPELVATRDVWHLATPIRGHLRSPDTDALTLAVTLHPTPAVAGTPTEAAIATIADVEGSRRFYGGAVGWCDPDGDGSWHVAIRCAEFSADGTRALAWAGGGIVADSDPRTEVEETTVKLATLCDTLGVRSGDR